MNNNDNDDAVSDFLASKNSKVNLEKIGIFLDDEKLHFNANIFVEFLMQRNHFCIVDGQLLFRYSEGVWIPFGEHAGLRLFRDTIEGVKRNIYKISMGNNALDILKLAVPNVPSMDSAKHLINLQNGLLDLKAFELLPHDPKYLSSIQLPIAYDPKEKCERFEQFITEIMEGDSQRVAVLQELAGYLLTSETVIHKAFFLYGDGSNGKSLLLDILTALVGEANVSNLTLADLSNAFRRYNLVGKTVNIATENEIAGKGFNSQYFKAIVAGDRIQVERKYQDSASFVPTCKLVFAVNNLPYSPDHSYGLYRRMMIIPFTRRFEEKEADKNLKAKLLPELPGILNWSLEGLKRLRAHNFEFSESSIIQNTVKTYIQDQNPMRNFISEMIVRDEETSRIAKASILQSYNLWSQRNGLGDTSKLSPQRFWNLFRANCRELNLPYKQQISNGTRYLRELRMADYDDPIPAPGDQIP